MSEAKYFEEQGHLVSQLLNEAGNTILWEYWMLDDKPDGPLAPDGTVKPAIIQRDAITGNLVREEWLKFGKRHRIEGPAVIRYDPENGEIVGEEYFIDGLPDRVDGPCGIERDPGTAAVVYEVWMEKGALSRSDAPAIIWRTPSSVVIREEWWNAGKFLRARQHDILAERTSASFTRFGLSNRELSP